MQSYNKNKIRQNKWRRNSVALAKAYGGSTAREGVSTIRNNLSEGFLIRKPKKHKKWKINAKKV